MCLNVSSQCFQLLSAQKASNSCTNICSSFITEDEDEGLWMRCTFNIFIHFSY